MMEVCLNYFKKNGAKTVGVEPTNAALEAKKTDILYTKNILMMMSQVK